MDEEVVAMEGEIFYTVEYWDSALSEQRTVLVSSPHTIARIKEILSEVHANWEIQDIVPKRRTEE